MDDRKSTSGYIFLPSGSAVSWRSQKQKCVALSTAKAEYVATARISLRQLIAEPSNSSAETPTLIYEDNRSGITMTKNLQFHGRV